MMPPHCVCVARVHTVDTHAYRVFAIWDTGNVVRSVKEMHVVDRPGAREANDTEPIRLIVIDDHQMFADSLTRVLTQVDDIVVLAAAQTIEDGYAAAVRHQPDVAVVDFHLPDGDGTALATRITAASPQTQVVILTAIADERVALASIEAGCAGFLTKDRALDELVLAVRTVHGGEAYVPQTMLARLLPRLRGSVRRVGSDLTRREREVLQLLADGKSNDAVARELILSRHTVRNHVQNVLSKLQAHSKLEAVAIAVREGLVRRSG
jgi:two-component system response regulator DevR